MVFFFKFYPYFSAAFIMAISNRQLRMTEGQMKQFGELLEGKTFFRSKVWGNETVRQLDTKSRTYMGI